MAALQTTTSPIGNRGIKEKRDHQPAQAMLPHARVTAISGAIAALSLRLGAVWSAHGRHPVSARLPRCTQAVKAFERVVERAGLGRSSVYALRHYAITLWLRAGVRLSGGTVPRRNAPSRKRRSGAWMRVAVETTPKRPPDRERCSAALRTRSNRTVGRSHADFGGVIVAIC